MFITNFKEISVEKSIVSVHFFGIVDLLLIIQCDNCNTHYKSLYLYLLIQLIDGCCLVVCLYSTYFVLFIEISPPLFFWHLTVPPEKSAHITEIPFLCRA